MAKTQNTITEREENLLIKWFEQAVEQLRTEIRRVEDKIAIHMAQNDKEHAEIIAQNDKEHAEIKEMIKDLKTMLWAVTGIIIGLMAVGFTTIGIILPLILRG
ncbi:MAG: hypothetical protein ACUVXI_12305 [bacterium]